MKAAVYDGSSLTFQEVPNPKPTNGQVLLKVIAVGVCGTDRAIVEGHLPVSRLPLIPGHEIIGRVVECRASVEPSWMGKRVAVEINSTIDFSCPFCKRKEFTQCISRKALGIDINGGFAEFIAVETYLLHEVPNQISDLDATFIEPLAAAYQTFEMMPVSEADRTIAIFGLGKLGLLILQIAHKMGLEIIAIDGAPNKLALAKKWGAKLCLNRHEVSTIVSEIKNHTQGFGCDIVVNTTGNPDAMPTIFASVRTRGKIHMKSTHGLDTPVNITDLVVREITMYSSRCGPFNKAIKGLTNGDIEVHEMISGTYPLGALSSAIEAYALNKEVIKNVILF